MFSGGVHTPALRLAWSGSVTVVGKLKIPLRAILRLRWSDGGESDATATHFTVLLSCFY